MTEVRRLSGAEAAAEASALAGVLVDCVEDGASVGFLSPLAPEAACAFFEFVAGEVDAGKRMLFAAYDDGALVGTVQIIPASYENQPHRADLVKLLVRRSARGKGVGSLLMEHAERAACEAGRTVLVLDTIVGSDAERLYERLGWTRTGAIPDYALMPDGALAATMVMWKKV